MKANNTPHYSDPRKYKRPNTTCGPQLLHQMSWKGRTQKGLKIFFTIKREKERVGIIFSLKKCLLHFLCFFTEKKENTSANIQRLCRNSQQNRTLNKSNQYNPVICWPTLIILLLVNDISLITSGVIFIVNTRLHLVLAYLELQFIYLLKDYNLDSLHNVCFQQT